VGVKFIAVQGAEQQVELMTVGIMKPRLVRLGKRLVRDIKALLNILWPGGPGSTPYSPPFKRSGDLRNSISYRISDARMKEIVLTVGSLSGKESWGGVPYAAILEFGGQAGRAYIYPRPYITPVMLNSLGVIKKYLGGEEFVSTPLD